MSRNVIVLSRVIIDLDNRLVIQWDDKIPGRLWLYMRDASSQYFEGQNAGELWNFYTQGHVQQAPSLGQWKEGED